VVTCPAALAVLGCKREQSLGSTPCVEAEGDCLPPDATVWVEGHNAPVRVDAVEAGARVLCFDHLTGGMKYSDVTSIQAAPGQSAAWVEVLLEDSTSLKMTADHPVYPCTSDGEPTGRGPEPVQAASLDPSLHSIQVLKLVAVPVKEVRSLTAANGEIPAGLPTSKVSVNVAQPVRHSIFASSQPGATACMAVASAEVNLRKQVRYQVKNTFIDPVEEESVSQLGSSASATGGSATLARRKGRRLRTAPALVSCASPPNSDTERTAAESGSGSGSEEESGHRTSFVVGSNIAKLVAARESEEGEEDASSSLSLGDGVCGGGGGGGARHVLGSSSGSSVVSWQSSLQSSLSMIEAAMLLSTGAVANRFNPKLTMANEAKGTDTVKLSDTLALRQQGLKSLGSIGHAQGWCMPCLMESWHYKDGPEVARPCKMGALCYRCHEQHTEEEVRDIRRLRRQEQRRASNRHNNKRS